MEAAIVVAVAAADQLLTRDVRPALGDARPTAVWSGSLLALLLRSAGAHLAALAMAAGPARIAGGVVTLLAAWAVWRSAFKPMPKAAGAASTLKVLRAELVAGAPATVAIWALGRDAPALAVIGLAASFLASLTFRPPEPAGRSLAILRGVGTAAVAALGLWLAWEGVRAV
jgi:hypothetical protein